MTRNRPAYAVWIVLVVVLGLATRWSRIPFLPDLVKTYGGDTLWALMVFLALGFLFPRARTVTLGMAALAISYSVECSQIYQADWINSIRSTRVGGLILGRGWVPTDLVCYTVGVAIGCIAEAWKHRDVPPDAKDA
ncbi:MAG: DUF2809 domain-containing protein [Verrucomicrobiaceae bacterium]|nr:MAG: DUF2809 domain-containing protein [Verrucomicrobiaceae bacterium]